MNRRTTREWMAASFLVGLIVVLIVRAGAGPGERVAMALRATARWSFLLFWLASAGGALTTLFGSRFQALAHRARDLGLSFASAHLVHLWRRCLGLLFVPRPARAVDAHLLRYCRHLDICAGDSVHQAPFRPTESAGLAYGAYRRSRIHIIGLLDRLRQAFLSGRSLGCGLLLAIPGPGRCRTTPAVCRHVEAIGPGTEACGLGQEAADKAAALAREIVSAAGRHCLRREKAPRAGPRRRALARADISGWSKLDQASTSG